jgi:predicted metalloprotease with PDZ domain
MFHSKTFYLSILTLCLSLASYAQTLNYAVDLTELKGDKLRVRLNCSGIDADEVIYYFPKTIPGTYATLDYGRYVSKFRPMDAAGKALEYEKLDVNSYKISNARQLASITYRVDDTWEQKKGNKIFEPAGTGFEEGEYLVINAGGVFGCFEGRENEPITVSVAKPDKLVSYTSLKESDNKGLLTYEAESYHQLLDNPILFSTQASESLTVGNCQVNIASYYPNDSASYYSKQKVEASFQAIEQFVGD